MVVERVRGRPPAVWFIGVVEKPPIDYVIRPCGMADRLLSRGLSKLSDDRPEHAGDLRLAAKVIRAMARSFGHADVVTLENGNG